MKKFGILPSLALAMMLAFTSAHNASAQGPVISGTPDVPAKTKQLKDTKKIKPIGPVNMSTGVVFPPGKAAVCLKARFFDKDNLFSGDDEQDGTYNGKYDRTQRNYNLSLRYGVAKDFDMRVMIPYRDSGVSRRSGTGTAKEATREDSNMGLGDMVVMGRYALWSQRDGDPLSVAFGAGVKMPSGDSNKKNPLPFSKSFEYMGPGFQLGTGSWDPKFELGLTRVFGRSRLDAHFMYTIGLEGDHGLQKGDQFKYDLGWTYALSSLLDVELELNGVNQNHNKNDGKFVANSGGRVLYLTPGVHFKFTDRFNAGLAFPYVIHRDLNSDDDLNKYGIGEDYQMVFKLAYKFN